MKYEKENYQTPYRKINKAGPWLLAATVGVTAIIRRDAPQPMGKQISDGDIVGSTPLHKESNPEHTTHSITLDRGVHNSTTLYIRNTRGPKSESVSAPLDRIEPVSNAPVAQEYTIWDALAACESNETWNANTGNGYYGGLQFDLRSWYWTGGEGLPSNASREEQIRRAEILVELRRIHGLSPYGAWPYCSRVVGLR